MKVGKISEVALKRAVLKQLKTKEQMLQNKLFVKNTLIQLRKKQKKMTLMQLEMMQMMMDAEPIIEDIDPASRYEEMYAGDE